MANANDPNHLFTLRIPGQQSPAFQIMGRYSDGVEEIDTATDKAEAKRLASEYRLAFGVGWMIWVRRTPNPMIVIHAFDQYPVRSPSGYGHSYIDVEVRQGGKVIFPRGTLYCGVNAYTSTDGIEARELVMSTVAMKPGDTDEDYFRSYTADQLAWAESNGEYLSMVRECRYCDSEGNLRS